MAKTHSNNIHNGTFYKGLLLDCSYTSGTELDYEYSESLLASEDPKADVQTAEPKVFQPKSPPKEVIRPQQATQDVRLQILSKSNVKVISKSYQESMASDILDLQRMAEKFATAKTGNLKDIEKIVYGVSGFNYEVVTRVDKLLEEAYNMLHTFQKKLDFTTRTKLLNLILALNELPHLHNSTHREKGKCARVTDWLNNHTCQPEPELCGFTMKDPVQLRKYVTDHIQPRVSSSDTNVTLGKRKRAREDSCEDDFNSIQKSSSDTLVYVHADWSRLKANGKRRRLRNN